MLYKGEQIEEKLAEEKNERHNKRTRGKKLGNPESRAKRKENQSRKSNIQTFETKNRKKPEERKSNNSIFPRTQCH